MLVSQQQISDEQLATISRVVYDHCGINLSEGKRELVQARIAKRMRIKAMGSVSTYLAFALDDSEEFTHLIDALSTNLTSFFREPAHFAHLVDTFIPELLARKQKTGQRRVRGWSAGCSTGEEPYSLAMALLQAVSDKAPSGPVDVKILATDLCTEVLAKARRGVFESARVTGIPQDLRLRFVHRDPEQPRRLVHMTQELKDVLRFAHLNLMNNWPFTGPFDFIFCRNVMIYFDKPTQEKLVNRFHDVLDTGGLLFTGHSESLTGVAHKFQYVQPTIYRKA